MMEVGIAHVAMLSTSDIDAVKLLVGFRKL